MRYLGLGQAAAALALLALGGCSSFGNPLVVFAQKREAPDEFQVLAREPLRMPTSATLPAPRPGAPSPLEPDPRHEAVVALLGPGAVPAAPAETEPSPGELALLSAADASAAKPGIRKALREDKTHKSSNKPYEPPLLIELFTGGDSTPKNVIDPAAEARRLQREGIAAAPIDPNAEPPVAEEEAPSGQTLYPSTQDRRPSNKLPSSGGAGF